MKRVAICFWGQTRTDKGLEQCYKLLKSESVEYDFFVSTWDDFESKEVFYSKLAHHETYELNVHSNDLKTDSDGKPYISADYYFLGTSLSFDLYSTGWKQYYKSKKPLNGKHGGHNYHGWVMSNLPFEIVSVQPEHEFLCNKLKPREVK